MKVAASFLMAVVVLCGAAVLNGQSPKNEPTAPRLRVATKMVKDGQTTVLMVDGVAQGGLGQQLGLRVGDSIRTFKVGDDDEIKINGIADLTEALVKIGEATKNKDRFTMIEVGVTTKSEPVKGAVFRTNLTDKTDGGTLFYFLDHKVLERMKETKNKK